MSKTIIGECRTCGDAIGYDEVYIEIKEFKICSVCAMEIMREYENTMGSDE